jgi:hypothetical protein
VKNDGCGAQATRNEAGKAAGFPCQPCEVGVDATRELRIASGRAVKPSRCSGELRGESGYTAACPKFPEPAKAIFD